MRRVPPDELESLGSAVEDLVDRTPEADPWCSGPDWVLSVHEGFGARSEPLILASDRQDVPGLALLARYRLDTGATMVAGLEPLWGFATPLLGPRPEAVAALAVDELAGLAWDHLVVPGLPELTSHDGLTARIARELSRLGPVGLGTGIVRQVADLAGGHDAWLARRSPRFRRSLAQAGHRAQRAGLELVDVSAEPDVFERLLAVEATSWKGQEGTGLAAPDMARTYRAMTARLQRRGRLRATVARLDGHDVGYILGGVRVGIYRGLQLSYATEVGGVPLTGLSVGHLLQHHQVRALCASGEATVYDLGMDLEYKRRWADRAVPSATLVVDRTRVRP